MVFPKKLADRQRDRNAALKQQKELLSRRARAACRRLRPTRLGRGDTRCLEARACEAKVAEVRMSGEPTLKLTVDGGNERQYLTSALA